MQRSASPASPRRPRLDESPETTPLPDGEPLLDGESLPGDEVLPGAEVLSDAELVAGLDIEPRDYQLRIARKAIAMFLGTHRDRSGRCEPPVHSVMVESPTGSGKTVIGLMIARYLQRRHGHSAGWVAMRRNLLAQAQRENGRRGFDVALRTISMFDKQPPAVDFLVVDEAQHDGATSMANLHCQIRPRRVLGLTATPYRTDRIKLCFDKVIQDAGIHALIQDGYLSRYHHYTIPEYTPEAVARFYCEHREKWGKSLVFFHRREQCEACHGLLRQQGVRTEVVTATSHRQRQLEDFESGRLDVLINMAILTEGFDCPDLQTVFCRPSGKSCTIQMAGRVLRKHPRFRFKQVVQCRQTRHPLLKTAMADEQYVWMDESWRTLTINRQLAAISQKTRKMMARSSASLPEWMGRHRARGLPWQQHEP